MEQHITLHSRFGLFTKALSHIHWLYRTSCDIIQPANIGYAGTIVGTSQEQQDATAQSKEAELEYFGIVMFGDTQELKEFTGKFSLYQ